jgi:uncharacterized protein (DUF2225 family)
MKQNVKSIHFNGRSMGVRKLSPFRLNWGTFVFLLIGLVIVFLLIRLFYPGESLAVTLFKAKTECPVCGTDNEFLALGSYGSYVYAQYPLQLVDWPVTRSFPLYMCKTCKYTAFMWDFKKLPEDKRPEIRQILDSIEFNKSFKDYSELPVSTRLEVAEKVYSVWEKDDRFWCRFYRIMGYHYEKEGDTQKAFSARMEALSFVEKMLADAKNKGIQKELLLISGAMKHFLRDDGGATADFKKALKLTFQTKKYSEEKNKKADEYYTNFLKHYIKHLQEGSKEKVSRK